MMFFGTSVYIGNSYKQLCEIKDALANANIKYKEKIISHNNQYILRGTTRSSFGSVGTSSTYDTQYEIIVKSKDADNAKFIIESSKKR